MKRWFYAGLLALWAISSGLAQNGDTRPQLSIERKDKTIRVIQNGRSADGARFIPGNPNCEKNSSISSFFAPEPGFVETIVNDTRITSAIALLKKPDEGEDEEVLELYSGTVDFTERTRCPENLTESSTPSVTIFEGRSTIVGNNFFYDNATGIGTMTGPVDLNRAAQGESAALKASADNLSINVDEDLTILEGNVLVETKTRISTAEVLELDEQTGVAILRGNPASSREGSDLVEGRVIEYDIDNNDVVVTESVRATFEY